MIRLSKYSLELRWLIENDKLADPLIPLTGLSLGSILASYPLENADFVNVLTTNTRREDLNQKIIDHYYFREIGFETVNRFLFHLQRKLNEIMPFYNQRYKSVDFAFNPLWNVDMSETFEHTVTGTGSTTTQGTNTNTEDSTNTSTSSGDSLTVDSDTPNQQLTEANIKANLYASKTAYNKGANAASNILSGGSTLQTDVGVDSTDSKTESFTRREFGSSKGYTFAQNIDQWRNIMLNVDMDVIKELETLFINLW